MGSLHINHILVVDDEEDLRSVIADAVSEIQGVQVWEAKDGVAALEFVKQQRVDVILSDIRMPHMTGLQLLAEIQNRFSHIPLVLMTAYRDPEKVSEARRLGAFELLEKPFQIHVLHSTLKRALESRSRPNDRDLFF